MQEAKEEGLEEGIIKGREQGLVEGKQQERETVAKNLLSLGMDAEFVIKATGLDKSDIEKLKTSLHIPPE
jgi:predicted transposase/invertase (TIGR01784 family)